LEGDVHRVRDLSGLSDRYGAIGTIEDHAPDQQECEASPAAKRRWFSFYRRRKNSSPKKQREPNTGCMYKDRPWVPRFWNGMTAQVYFAWMWRNHFAVSPGRIPMLFAVGSCTFINTALSAVQSLTMNRKIARTKIEHPPVFIVGHWRSGTTLLHELMVLDQRHTYPTTYECFTPSHFLISGKVLPSLLRSLLPQVRPMDNMAAGWERPQEDEFALCNMGVPSPYLTVGFPNRPPHDPEYLDLEHLPAEAVEHWKQQFLWFLKCVTLRSPKRIVLKSPPHTCRIKPLLELFPDARFVHIARNPYSLFPSTVNLWKRLYQFEGFQFFKGNDLEDLVFRTLERMYDAYERQRKLVPPGRLCDVRYEELVKNPVGEMERVYGELGLGEFEAVRPALQQYMAGQKDYQKNRYEMEPETKRAIASRWQFYFDRYGYPT
jgi:omega-hydroxy-beta-dihydromenaquinone-9 sulfotransferase